MYDRILKRMQERIRTLQYVMTLHAEEEMDNDDLSVFDIESCILTGMITERQKDAATQEWKYVIEGQSVAGDPVCAVAKLGFSEKLVIITVYLA
jgi:hypothetical protein